MRALLTAALLVVPTVCPAQDSRFFVELAGNSLLGATANMEVALSDAVALRAGMGVDFYSSTSVWPLQAVLLAGAGRSKLELDAGLTIAHENQSGDWDWDGTRVFFTAFLGYRYQRPGGLLLRVGVVPLLWTNTKLPWAALGLGVAF